MQGYTAIDPVTGAIITTGQPTDIVVPPGVLRAPVATSAFRTLSNLDVERHVGDGFNTPVQIYDSLGASHVMTITYTRTAAGWDYEITVAGGEVTGGTAAYAVRVAAGAVTFDGPGKSPRSHRPRRRRAAARRRPLHDVTFTTPAWANGATASTITWDLVDPNGVVSLTGYASPSATSSKTQNGAAAGHDRQHQHQRRTARSSRRSAPARRWRSGSSRSPASTTRRVW